MKTKILTISLIAVLAMLLSGPATAQGPQPPVPPYPPHELGKPLGPFRTPDGYWFKPEGARLPLEATGISPQATGGPDDYGYTWSDELTFSWIDAKSLGINANLYGGDVYTGPVNIDFAFPFYENNYYSVNYETYICDGVEYPQIWANEVIIGPHIQPAGYFSNPAKLKNQP